MDSFCTHAFASLCAELFVERVDLVEAMRGQPEHRFSSRPVTPEKNPITPLTISPADHSRIARVCLTTAIVRAAGSAIIVSIERTLSPYCRRCFSMESIL